MIINRNLGKSVKTFCVNNGQLSPSIPKCNVDYFQYLQQLAKVSQHCLMGKGKEEMKVIVSLITLKKIQDGLRSGFSFTHYFLKITTYVQTTFFPRLQMALDKMAKPH